MNQFISVSDVPDLPALVDSALEYKREPYLDEDLGRHKTLGMIFLNPSMRTRISTQVAAHHLGMEVIVFNIDKEGWALEFGDGKVMNGSTTEHIREAAGVMGRYFDILSIRTFPGFRDKMEDYQERHMKQFIRFAGIPVVSLESCTLHPLQSLADIVTIKDSWNQTRKPKVVLSWAPHIKSLPQAVPNSFAQWMNAWGEADFLITHPPGFELDPEFTRDAPVIYDQTMALEGADYVYVKNWASYREYGKVGSDPDWMLNLKKLSITRGARVMHCLPVRRNLVIADEVLDHPCSLVLEQAANRVCAAQAVLAGILRSSQNRPREIKSRKTWNP